PAMAFVPVAAPRAAPQARTWPEAPLRQEAAPARFAWQEAPAPAWQVPQPPQPPSGQAPAAAWQDVPAPQPAARPWAGTGIERAIRQAVGWTQLVGAEPGRYAVRVGRCASCI